MFNLNKRRQAVVPEVVTITTEAAAPAQAFYQSPEELVHQEIKLAVHQKLIDEVGGALFVGDALAPDASDLIRRMIQDAVNVRGELVTRHGLDQLHSQMLDEIRGLGPLEPLLADPLISEIMVNSASQVFVERDGKILPTRVRFQDDAHLLRIIDRVVNAVGRHVDEATPMCDARLPDGSRVNAIIPPLALNGPCLTIRRFSKDPLKIADLVSRQALTEPMAAFIRACVEGKLNIVVSGGTGSGKTTMLNVLSSFIPAGERLVTIEDAAELQLQQPHVIRLETRQANNEGVGAVPQGDLLRNTLRMRPDRIIIGEVRGGEALSMLQAMNTGHEGSLTTIHANTCRDALSRLETMVLMAGMDLPHRAIREQVAAALDLVIQIERSPDGKRRVTQISEIVGMEGEVYLLQDLFRWVPLGRGPEGESLGQHRPTGIVPRCQARLEEKGLAVALGTFQGAQA